MTSLEYLQKAYLLAKRANFKDIRPNPFVGALIVDQQGEILGEGYHQKIGQAHAEVHAINNALSKNKDLSRCTLYVTLEPCSHTGKTPPCTELIIANKIPKVVIGSKDPNPLVSGIRVLSDAGIHVEICLMPELEELNSTFNINQTKKRPKYLLKSAITLNGKIADRLGNSKWISNEKSRNYVHENLRQNVDAIITTAQTVIKDNATMNIRIKNADPKELNLIIIDRGLALLEAQNKKLNIFYERKESKIYLLTDRHYTNPLPPNVEIVKTNFNEETINITELNSFFLNNNIYSILIEAGGKLNTALLKQQLIDELAIFICPSLLIDRDAIEVFYDTTFQSIENKVNLKLIDTVQFENDLLLKYKLCY